MKTILIVGGGVEAVKGIQRAKELGLRVVVADGNPEAPGRRVADDFIQADIYNPEEAVEKAVEYSLKQKIDGVLAMASDTPVTVSSIARELGLPSHSLETARLATDKLAMKKCFNEHGVPTPDFIEINSVYHLEETMRNIDFPAVIKPVDSRGARGVLRLNKEIDLNWVYNYALSYSKAKKLILERWIPGPQISTESVCWDDEHVLVATGDRNYDKLKEYFPFIIENGGGSPSYLSPEIDQELENLINKARQAIGLKRGTVKGDVVITDQGPVIIEIAARLSGGYYSTVTIPLVYDVDIVGTAINISLGIKPNLSNLRRKPRCYMANRFLFLREGIIKSISITNDIEQQDWLRELVLYVKPGDKIGPVTDHTKRSGMVLTVADSREEAHRLAEESIKCIVVAYE